MVIEDIVIMKAGNNWDENVSRNLNKSWET